MSKLSDTAPMSDDEDETQCPLCMEEMDLSDKNFLPCPCGYRVCIWCWHHIRGNLNGLCPACRTPYNEDPHAFAAVDSQDIIKKNRERRQKEKQEKKITEKPMPVTPTVNAVGAPVPNTKPVTSTQQSLIDRRHLHNYRVVQRNLIYAVGVPSSIASEELLKKPEYFGQYGKMSKIVVHRNHSSSTTTVSAYVTFAHKEDAKAAIQALDGFWIDNNLIRASFGTTKYCNNFIRGVPCNNPDCVYLHELGEDEDRFTKEEIQAGQSKLTPSPGANQTIVTGCGGPSGTGKRPTGEPVFPAPVFIQDLGSGRTSAVAVNANIFSRDASTSSAFTTPSKDTVAALSSQLSAVASTVATTTEEQPRHAPTLSNSSSDQTLASIISPSQVPSNQTQNTDEFSMFSNSDIPDGSSPSKLSMCSLKDTNGNHIISNYADTLKGPGSVPWDSYQQNNAKPTQNDSSVPSDKITNFKSLPFKLPESPTQVTRDSEGQEKPLRNNSMSLASEGESFATRNLQSTYFNSSVTTKPTVNHPNNFASAEFTSTQNNSHVSQLLMVKRPDIQSQPGFYASFNGFGKCAVFPVPVSSFSMSIWSNIIRQSKDDLKVDPFGKLTIPLSELFDLTLPPVDAYNPPLSTPWPKPMNYYVYPSTNNNIDTNRRTSNMSLASTPGPLRPPSIAVNSGNIAPFNQLSLNNSINLQGMPLNSVQQQQHQQQQQQQQQQSMAAQQLQQQSSRHSLYR